MKTLLKNELLLINGGLRVRLVEKINPSGSATVTTFNPSQSKYLKYLPDKTKALIAADKRIGSIGEIIPSTKPGVFFRVFEIIG